MSASGVAVMLRGSGITVRSYTDKAQRDKQVERIFQVLWREFGPLNAPEEMLRASAKGYYQVFCKVLAKAKARNDAVVR